jgi:putative hydrolase of HD superfamily
VSDRLVAQLAFLRELDKAKNVLRQSHVEGSARREDDAQHQWHVAVMALLLAEHAEEPVDVSRVVAMLLLHDVVEIDAGDVFVYDEAAQVGKREREEACADRLYGLLPPDQATWARALWEEFEAKETPEARFAGALDRLQPLLQNLATGGEGWRRNGITADRVLALNSRIARSSPALWEHAERLLHEAIDQGVLALGPAAEG